MGIGTRKARHKGSLWPNGLCSGWLVFEMYRLTLNALVASGRATDCLLSTERVDIPMDEGRSVAYGGRAVP